MRRILASATGLAALALGTGLLSSCPGLHPHREGEKSGHCPLPIVQAQGRFYLEEEGKRAILDAAGTFPDPFDPEGDVQLKSVTLFGLTGHHTVAEVTEGDAYAHTFLMTITTDHPYWLVTGLETSGGSAWDGGPSYTLVVRHHYAHKTSQNHWLPCTRDRAMHFDSIAPTPHVPGVDDEAMGGTQSHTAAATCSGSFFGTMGYALYDGQVNYDQATHEIPRAIEVYSSSSRPSLFDADNLFYTKPGSELGVDTWMFSGFTTLYDPNYDGSDTWFVGFRVLYSDGTQLAPTKKFVALVSKQGTIVPGN